jgi:hypothetical protein
MENIRLRHQAVKYTPTGRKIGGDLKYDKGTKFIFKDRNKHNSLNPRSFRRRRRSRRSRRRRRRRKEEGTFNL